MSRLTAEKRLDKNGRLVTRHVKTDVTAFSPDRGIPAPKQGKQRPTSKSGYAKEISKFLLEAAGEEEMEIVESAYTTHVGIRPLKLIYDRMYEWGERDSDTFENVMASIIVVSNERNYSQSKRDRLVTSLVEGMPVISAFGGNSPQPRTILSMIENADDAATLYRIPLNIDYVVEHDRSSFRLLMFDKMIKSASAQRTREQLTTEAHWFDENMDALALHTGTLMQRQTTDASFLKELVSGDGHTAMSSGLL